jgi:putative phage-type endonuclease
MIEIFKDLEQGTQEWFDARCGIITASDVGMLVTPSLKVANNDKTRAYIWELAAQRVSQSVEPMFMSYDMERGSAHEEFAADFYDFHYSLTEKIGFVKNSKHGFTLGYSPDRFVGEDGLLEIKCPRQKEHFKTICEGGVPDKHLLQCQAGLLATERKWLDFVSYCEGFKFYVYRVYPDPVVHEAIIEAGVIAEQMIEEYISIYGDLEAPCVEKREDN